MNAEFSFSSQRPVLVDFSANWCSSCQALDPILNELTKDLPKERFLKIDTELHPQIAAAFSVKSIPTLMIFEKGKIIWKHTGLIARTILKEKLEEHLKFNE